jgi:hypothetical protein
MPGATAALVMLWREVPEGIRSNNRPEFVVAKLREWLAMWGRKRCISSRAVLGKNGYWESFNGELQDECLNRQIFSLAERGTDRDREVAGGIQHKAAPFAAELQPPSTSGP